MILSHPYSEVVSVLLEPFYSYLSTFYSSIMNEKTGKEVWQLLFDKSHHVKLWDDHKTTQPQKCGCYFPCPQWMLCDILVQHLESLELV